MVSKRFNKKLEEKGARLRNKEMEQAQPSDKTQVWHTKQLADKK